VKPIQTLLKTLIKNLPPFGQILEERDQLRIENQQLKKYGTWVPLGHFYSPIPLIEEIKKQEAEIFDQIPRSLPGIHLNEQTQLDLLNQFQKYYAEQPFESHKSKHLRYFFENPSYSYSDAIFFYCMLRHLKPKRVIEVGSGYSSCVLLDVNQLYFENQVACTFIEPYPELLESLIQENDRDHIQILAKPLQAVATEQFAELSAGDILFIDSTHVTKVNSDVNHIFFRILPSLQSGVYIHFHDIFYPFEYPKEWVYEGRAWNEAYLLRAFLQHNSEFEIQFCNTFLEHFYEDKFIAEMPLCLKNRGGSIWLKKK
jgi:predicted O-methyltransferase YrrM